MSQRKVAVVTGSRAEFGLLRPVMRAVSADPGQELFVIAAGSHLISPALTLRDVQAEFRIFDSVPMQIAGRTGRAEDAQSVARGIARFARIFERIDPDWVVVLGDRIEAFAAGGAASIGGWALAHVHGGDRAEGVADEAMRHAITKLAHLHLAATEQSRERIVRLGERPEHVYAVGSPAIDDLGAMPALDDAAYEKLGSPRTVMLLHPVGREAGVEGEAARRVLDAIGHDGVLAMHPNHDAGREGILAAVRQSGVRTVEHLRREVFVGLLKRLAAIPGTPRGVLIGNSSAGLIEAAALGVPVVDVGARQNGRECPGMVSRAEDESAEAIVAAVGEARGRSRGAVSHPYGDGRAGARIAEILGRTDGRCPALRRKRNTY